MGDLEIDPQRAEADESPKPTRREILQRMVAGAVLPAFAPSHPIYRLMADGLTLDRAEKLREAVDWKPLFLNAEQNRILVALSEVVVPGSASAKVNQFVDLLLSVDRAEHRRDFIGSLAAVEDEARRRFRRGFARLEQGEQEALIADFSKGDAHGEAFQNLKEWIAGAYYSSEQGMRELGWNGNYAFDSFSGCEPGEH